jgi:DHA1 family multidrug resistance protein-like MFS transporter
MRRLLAAMFAVTIAMGMTSLALPLYAKDLGASYTEVGLLGVTYVVFNVLLSVPAGRMADRYGRKLPLSIGLFSIACIFLLYAWQASVLWLLSVRLLQGVGEAPIWVNAQTAVADVSPRAKRGRAMGTYGTSWAAGFALGPLIGGSLYVAAGAREVFLLSGIVAFAATAIMLATSLPKPKITFKRTSLKGLWVPCLAGLVYLGVVAVVLTLFPPYGRALGLSGAEIGGLLTTFAMIRALLFIPMGGLSDRFGPRPVILMGLAGAAVASAVLGAVTGYLSITLAVVVLAGAESAIYPAAISMASEIGGGASRGYVLGIFNAVAMAGWGILPGIGGALADIVGPTAPYFMCALVAAITLIVMWKVLPRK